MKQSIRGIFTGFMLAHDPTARAETILVTPWRGTMRRMVTAMLSMLIVFAATAGVASATDKSKFDNLIGKSATDVSDLFDKFNPKAGCTCQGAPYANWPGVLVRTGEPGEASIYCMVVIFNASGGLAGNDFCANFTVLTK